MNVLAIETATESCSVALLCGDDVIDRSEVAPRRHAELVLPMADALLAEAGMRRSQLDAIAVGRGPGAFTGVRLGISLAQGLALALDRPVATASSLAALALEAPAAEGETVLALIDARMGEVYAGAYRRLADGTLELLVDECVCPPEEVPMPLASALHVVGTGWGAYGEIIAERLPGVPLSAEADRYPQARHVARLALQELASGADLAPERALPVYLRDKVALTLAEQGR